VKKNSNGYMETGITLITLAILVGIGVLAYHGLLPAWFNYAALGVLATLIVGGYFLSQRGGMGSRLSDEEREELERKYLRGDPDE